MKERIFTTAKIMSMIVEAKFSRVSMFTIMFMLFSLFAITLKAQNITIGNNQDVTVTKTDFDDCGSIFELSLSISNDYYFAFQLMEDGEMISSSKLTFTGDAAGFSSDNGHNVIHNNNGVYTGSTTLYFNTRNGYPYVLSSEAPSLTDYFIKILGHTVIQEGESINFTTVICPTSDNYTYQWYENDIAIASQTNADLINYTPTVASAEYRLEVSENSAVVASKTIKVCTTGDQTRFTVDNWWGVSPATSSCKEIVGYCNSVYLITLNYSDNNPKFAIKENGTEIGADRLSIAAGIPITSIVGDDGTTPGWKETGLLNGETKVYYLDARTTPYQLTSTLSNEDFLVTQITQTQGETIIQRGQKVSFSSDVCGSVATEEITYQWYKSINGGLDWTAIEGATAATLINEEPTTDGTIYKIIASTGSLTSNSNEIKINFLPPSIIVGVTGANTINEVEYEVPNNKEVTITASAEEMTDVSYNILYKRYEGQEWRDTTISGGEDFWTFTPSESLDYQITATGVSTSTQEIETYKKNILIRIIYQCDTNAPAIDTLLYDDFGHFINSTTYVTRDAAGVEQTYSGSITNPQGQVSSIINYFSADPNCFVQHLEFAGQDPLFGPYDHELCEADGYRHYACWDGCDGYRVEDGYYAILPNPDLGNCGSARNDYWDGSDHTGNDNGGMLFLNCSEDSKDMVLYEREFTINSDCDDVLLLFSAYISNAAISDVSKPVNVRLDIFDENDILIHSVLSGDIMPRTTGEKWSNMTFKFRANGQRYKIKLVNNNEGGAANFGNEILLDDISIVICYPNINLISDLSDPSIKLIDTWNVDTTVNLYAFNENDINSYIDNPKYIFQYRKEDGNWQNLTEITAADYTSITLNSTDVRFHGTTKFRTIVASSEEIINRINNGENFPVNCEQIYAIDSSFTVIFHYGEPIEIATAADLVEFRDAINNPTANSYKGITLSDGGAEMFFKLTADIDLSGVCNSTAGSWIPIGRFISASNTQPFKGHFNGDNHTISNLYIRSANTSVNGLFGCIDSASITNLQLTNTHVFGGSYVGSLCGMAKNHSHISNCANNGSVSGVFFVGGVCGELKTLSDISNCFNNGSVKGYSDYTGGVCGILDSISTISYCFNSSSINGLNNYTGGVCGWANNNSKIESSISYGYLLGNINVGGVCGRNSESTITSCYYDKQMCSAVVVAGQAVSKLTSEMVGDGLKASLGETNWEFAEGMYPRPKGMENTDAAIVAATPIFLSYIDENQYEIVDNMNSDFTVGTANGVSWRSNQGKVSFSGNIASFINCDGQWDTLTVSKNTAFKAIAIRCIPCNKPDQKPSGKYVEIESSQDVIFDTVRLCNESPTLTLSVNDVNKAAGGAFDIFWFDNAADMSNDANAINSDVTGSATTLSIGVQWSDITEGATKTYYVKVRDHESPTNDDCYVFDSIKVQSCITPVVPAITIDPICAGSLSDSELAAIVDKFYFDGFISEVNNQSGTPLTSTELSAEIASLNQGVYQYTVTITDAITGCVSDEETVTLTVNGIAIKDFSEMVCDSYTWNGVEYTTSGDYIQNFQTIHGCDSIVTLHLTVYSSPDATITATDDVVCSGETVTLSVNAANADSIVWKAGNNILGINASIDVVPTVTTDYAVEIYETHNSSFRIANYATDFAPGDIVTTDNCLYKQADTAAFLASGKTALGIVYKASGDIIRMVNVEESNLVAWSFGLVITGAADLNYGMNNYNAIANFIQSNGKSWSNYPAFNYVKELNDNTSGGKSDWYLPAKDELKAMWKSTLPYNDGTDYVSDCDIKTTLNSTLAAIGETQLWDSVWYWSSSECYGQYSAWRLKNSGRAHYTFKYLTATARAVRASVGETIYLFNNSSITCSGTETKEITVNPTSATEFSETVCDSYTWNGVEYTTSGDYIQNLQTIHGCDSIVTLHLTVNYAPAIVDNIATPATIVHGEALALTEPQVNDNGATITASGWQISDSQYFTGTVEDYVAGQALAYTYNNWYLRYYATNDCGTAYSNAVQITVLGLPVIDPIVQPAPICYGESLSLVTPDVDFRQQPDLGQGWQLSENDAFTDTVNYTGQSLDYSYDGWHLRYFARNNAGITYSNTVQITVNPEVTINAVLNQTLCNGESTESISFGTTTLGGTMTYSWYNSNTAIGLAETGIGDIASFIAVNNGTTPLVATITATPVLNMHGIDCQGDSISFTITVNPTSATEFSETVCDIYTWNGVNYTASGDYIQNLQTIHGCDSIVTLHLTVNYAPTIVDNIATPATIVHGEALALTEPQVNGNGAAITASGWQISENQYFTGTVEDYVAGQTLAYTYNNWYLRYFATNGCGTTYSNAVQIMVLGLPVIDPIVQPAPICYGESLSLVTPDVDFRQQPDLGHGWQLSENDAFTDTINYTGQALDYSYDGWHLRYFARNNAGITYSNTVQITVNPEVTINAVLNQTLCNGESTESISFGTTTLGGTMTYSWHNSNTAIGLAETGSGDIASFIAVNNGTTPLVATITATPVLNMHGIDCQGDPITFTITVNPTPVITITAPESNYCPGSTLTLSATLSVGATPMTVSWDGDLTPDSQYVDGIMAYATYILPATCNTYYNISLQATDGNGCISAIDNAVINAYDTESPVISGNISTQTCLKPGNCAFLYPDVRELVRAIASDNCTATNSLIITQMPVENSVIDGFGNKTVTVTVADGCGNTSTIDVIIAVPEEFAVTGTSYNDLVCYDADNGDVTVSVSGGEAPYTFNLTGQETATSGETYYTLHAFDNLSAGDYSVTVTDANGCTVSESFTLSQPAELEASVNPIVSPSCHGGGDGHAVGHATGGVAPYRYEWSTEPAFVGQYCGNLSAGSYTLTVTDANGCTDMITFVVEDATLVTATIDSYGNPTCNGANNGWAEVTGDGGHPGYTYLWSNGMTTRRINGLGIGTYSVTVTDNNGCEATASVTLTEPESIALDVNTHDVTCFGGSDGWATATAQGGEAPYTFRWSNGSNSNYINHLTAGNYSVTVTDANGCEATREFEIAEPSDLTAGAIATDGEIVLVSQDPSAIASVVDATSGLSLTYRWKADGMAIANSNSATYDPSDTYTAVVGTVVFTREVKDACHEWTASEGEWILTVQPPQSVSENSFDGMKIYPNPTKNDLKIECAGMKRVKVVTALGQVIDDVELDADEITLHLDNHSAGMYFINIYTDYGMTTRRITVIGLD